MLSLVNNPPLPPPLQEEEEFDVSLMKGPLIEKPFSDLPSLVKTLSQYCGNYSATFFVPSQNQMVDSTFDYAFLILSNEKDCFRLRLLPSERRFTVADSTNDREEVVPDPDNMLALLGKRLHLFNVSCSLTFKLSVPRDTGFEYLDVEWTNPIIPVGSAHMYSDEVIGNMYLTNES